MKKVLTIAKITENKKRELTLVIYLTEENRERFALQTGDNKKIFDKIIIRKEQF